MAYGILHPQLMGQPQGLLSPQPQMQPGMGQMGGQMAGQGGLLGQLMPEVGGNRFYQAYDGVRNTLSSALLNSVGHKSGQEAVRGAAQGAMVGMQADQVLRVKREEAAKAEQKKNQTMALLVKKRPDLVPWVESGAITPSEAFNQAFGKSDKSEIINAGDGKLYDPSTGKWITAPGGSSKAPDVKEFFDEQTGQPYKAIWNPETGQYERFGGVKAPNGMTFEMGPDGSFRMVQGPAGAGLNVDQGKNTGFLIRGRESHKVISELEQAGTSLWNKTMRGLPGGVGNYGLDPDAQKFEQAKRDFVNAVLRRESGAVISDEEFENANQQYFPQPGDGPEVIAQKRRNRENAVKGFEIGAGPGAAQVPDASPRRYRFNPATGDFE